MRRVLPVILILIALSVFGILFLQMQWIQSAMAVQRAQQEREHQMAISQIKTTFQEEFLNKAAAATTQIWIGEASKQYFLEKNLTAQAFTEAELTDIIRKALRTHNIRHPFEYSIINMFNFSIVSSKGYAAINEEDKKLHTVSIPLSPRNAMQPETLYLYLEEPRNYLIRQLGWMVGASVLLTGIIISAFALTLRTALNQRKLSMIKSDFINNMTHEFKTPLATISLAVDALTNNKVISDEDKIRYYSGMIKEENKRMNKQVETILEAARIERQEVKLHLQPIDTHAVIRHVAETLSLQIAEKGGVLNLKLQASRFTVSADEVHFSNIIFNLLDNAIKYSKPTGPAISVETVNTSNGSQIAIKVRDNGIGMNKETQVRVFERFFRAHTGNLHNVKGFGLGLSYVKAIVQAHGGRIRLQSAPEKGSTFTVQLPVVS